VSHGGPGTLDPLAAVEGILPGYAFSPTVCAVAVRREQKNAAAVGTSEARLEEMDERHVNFAESDGFNLHNLETNKFTPETQSPREMQRKKLIFRFSLCLRGFCGELFF
jgi:hypothetical protein